MTDRPKPSRPEETPPRRRGGPAGWLAGGIPGAVAVAFLIIVIVVAVLALL